MTMQQTLLESHTVPTFVLDYTVPTSVPNHTVSMELVTPDMARSWLTDRPYKGQRILRAWWVKYLARQMVSGQFRSSAQIIFSVENGEGCFLINGQHTLNAILLCGIPQFISVQYLESAGKVDTASTYGVIDTGIKRRPGDLFSAMYLKEELELNATNFDRLATAVKFIAAKFLPNGNDGRENNDEWAERIREYGSAAHQFFDATTDLPSEMRSIYRSSSLGVGLVTFRYSAPLLGLDKVKAFWQGVALDNGLIHGDARKAANRHLLTTNMSNKGGVSKLKTNTVSAHYSARVIASCFNAYMEGKTLKQPRVDNATEPIRITGSPFKGKE